MPNSNHIYAPRTPWLIDFPDVLTHCTVAERDQHEKYAAAKSGDHGAAVALVFELINATTIEKIAQLTKDYRIAGNPPLIVPVAAIEKHGYNAIPSAMSEELSIWLHLPVHKGELRQINKVGHTRAPSWQRIVTPPLFSGDVIPERNYILVDDHVGVGGTLANIRGYIEDKGGRVVAMTTLTASQDAEKISLTSESLNMLKSKYGQELEAFWQEHFGYGLECLTAIEARNIARQPSVDAIRRFLFKAADEANRGGIVPVTCRAGEALTP